MNVPHHRINRFASLVASIALLWPAMLTMTPQPAAAEPGLAVGACVVADKRNPGRITAVRSYGYEVKGFGPRDTPMTWPTSDVVAAPCPAGAAAPASGAAPAGGAEPAGAAAPRGGRGVCFASDRPGGSGLASRVRAIIVRSFSHEPQPGEDGRVTVHVRSLALGATHGATPMDRVQYQTIEGRPMYDVRTTFETCTDYNRRDVFVTRDRNFVCFTRASGGLDCSMTASSAALAHDVTREVPR